MLLVDLASSVERDPGNISPRSENKYMDLLLKITSFSKAPKETRKNPADLIKQCNFPNYFGITCLLPESSTKHTIQHKKYRRHSMVGEGVMKYEPKQEERSESILHV